MSSEPNDTHPEIARLQIEMLRQATPQRRLELMNMLVRSTRELAWYGMKMTHPEMSEAELDYLWLQVNYGTELADRVRSYLEQRRR